MMMMKIELFPVLIRLTGKKKKEIIINIIFGEMNLNQIVISLMSCMGACYSYANDKHL